MNRIIKLAIGGAAALGAVAGVGASASAATLPPTPVGFVFVIHNTGGSINVTLNNGKKPVTTNIIPNDPCTPPSNPPFGAVTYNHVCLAPSSSG